ncbi:hypothetical protein AS156_39800 [Bradyrhizobium macuxiense]|uniref:Uncharacterized protein n=1 Tax=Bradyrhizobium macuxiense TaxID=1755647 RepID=A0A109JYP0_9BRAD|nr:hypothetical protein AS156_39800 [Bradyrhizobium macuxiense]
MPGVVASAGVVPPDGAAGIIAILRARVPEWAVRPTEAVRELAVHRGIDPVSVVRPAAAGPEAEGLVEVVGLEAAVDLEVEVPEAAADLRCSARPVLWPADARALRERD